MSCSTAWNELQKLTKITFILHWISFALYIVGFATPVWVSGSIPFRIINHDGEVVHKITVHALGLWQGCSGYFVAVRFFACIGLISSIFTALFVFWFTCMPNNGNRALILTIIMSYITAILLCITVGVFWGEYRLTKEVGFSFSFGMTFMAAACYFVSACLFLVNIFCKPSTNAHILIEDVNL